MRNTKLNKLYQRVDRCSFCKASGNKLQHIHGYGTLNPKLMLILINPTHRNVSAHHGYHGPRFPFIGVRQFWRVLAEGGLIDQKVARSLPLRSGWNSKHTKLVQRELIRNKLFLTNVVKCCYDYSAYPSGRVIKDQTKLLAEEIRIVNPKKIVAFGGLVYKTLTGRNVKLSKYWYGQKREKVCEATLERRTPIVPCYFPIGRGKPKEAAEILRQLA